MFRILHLSDLHFGADHYFSGIAGGRGAGLVEAIADAIKDKVDGIILSGDFFSKNQEEDLKKAKPGLRALLNRLQTDRVVFVPGNHDIAWGKEGSKQCSECGRRLPISENMSATERLHHYDLLVSSTNQQRMEYENFPVVVNWDIDNHRRVVFVLLSSCEIEGRSNNGLGYVGHAQLFKAKQKLLDEGSEKDKVLFGVLHHHLLPINAFDLWDPELESEGKLRGSMTLDAPTVLRWLSEQGATAVFHGHQHENAILRFENLSRRSRDLTVFAAGSVAVKEPEATNRQFYLYEIGDKVLTARSFRSDGSAFDEETQRVSIPLKFEREFGTNESVCREDTCVRVPELIPADRIALEGPDSSSLFYLFLTAQDTILARRCVQQAVEHMATEDVWDQQDIQRVRIEGMYDVMGRWDVVVRLRVIAKDEGAGDISPFFDLIGAQLLQRNLLSSGRSVPWFDLARLLNTYAHSEQLLKTHPELFAELSKGERDKIRQKFPALDPSEPTNDYDSSRPRIDTDRPWISWEDNAELYKMNRPIDVRLEVRNKEMDGWQRQSTEFYDSLRCQRAFVCVRIPASKRMKLLKTIRNELFGSLEHERDEKDRRQRIAAREIVEQVSIANDAIVFDVFMKCSQTLCINSLNRLLEKCLPNHQTRNYTLLCFDYDEQTTASAQSPHYETTDF